MLEYASIRFKFDCATPTTVPTIMVRMASAQMTGVQSARSGSSAERNTRTNAAMAAAFTPVDMKPVTTVGAPSYASGDHMWNGTAAILNAKPTIKRPVPSRIIGLPLIDCAAIAVDRRSMLVVPDTVEERDAVKEERAGERAEQ